MSQLSIWGDDERDERPTTEQVAHAYITALCPTLPPVRLPLASGIRRAINAAMKREPSWGLAAWMNYFHGVRQCPFLLGQIKPWKANLVWLVGPKNMAKVLAGAYIRVETPAVSGRAQRIRETIGRAYGLSTSTGAGLETDGSAQHHHGVSGVGGPDSRGDQFFPSQHEEGPRRPLRDGG